MKNKTNLELLIESLITLKKSKSPSYQYLSENIPNSLNETTVSSFVDGYASNFGEDSEREDVIKEMELIMNDMELDEESGVLREYLAAESLSGAILEQLEGVK